MDERTCAVDGCDRPATGETVLWGDVAASLCQEHATEVRAQPTDWNGALAPDGASVERLWRRQGVGEAS